MTKLKADNQMLHDVINAVKELPEDSLPENVQAWILQTAMDELHVRIAAETSQQINKFSEGFAEAQAKEDIRKKTMKTKKHSPFSLRRLF